jgi:C4-dicarboxylate-specific signal transduction histidine kinase
MPKTFMAAIIADAAARRARAGRMRRMAAPLSPKALRGFALVVLALGGAGIVAAWGLSDRRAAFDTEGRIAHRLLSQRASQLDATLATLTLLQPAAAEAAEQRLPAFVPSVLQVLRRDAGEPWPGDAAQRQALDDAEARSRPLRRAVLAQADLASGRYLLVQAGTPASFALWVDARALVPGNDWPYAAPGRAQVTLALNGQRLALTPATAPDSAAAALRFHKPLATDSQPFELQVLQPLRLSDLPWGGIAAWWLLLAAAAWAQQAWARQRAERRRAQELLRLGQVGRLNALGELAAGMAHELNQPLAAVSANAQAAQRLLADDEPDLAAARGAMAQAVQQARRAADVVARLRRLVERPDVGTRLQPCALAPTLRGALDLLQPEAQRLGVAVQLQADDDALQAQADPVALEQILHNLLTNALQALAQVPAGERRLRLHLRRNGAQAQLDVADSGPGIAPDALPHLFEPFFTTRDGGLGLGLSLCDSLATGMGGALSVAAAQPRGAVFTLSLPAA